MNSRTLTFAIQQVGQAGKLVFQEIRSEILLENDLEFHVISSSISQKSLNRLKQTKIYFVGFAQFAHTTTKCIVNE